MSEYIRKEYFYYHQCYQAEIKSSIATMALNQ